MAKQVQNGTLRALNRARAGVYVETEHRNGTGEEYRPQIPLGAEAHEEAGRDCGKLNAESPSECLGFTAIASEFDLTGGH